MDINHSCFANSFAGGILRLALTYSPHASDPTDTETLEQKSSEFFRSVADKVDHGLFDAGTIYISGDVCLTPSTLKWYLGQQFPGLAESNLSDRVDMALTIATQFNAPNLASLVRCLIRPNEIPLLNATRASQLLASLAYSLGRKIYQRTSPYWEDLLDLIGDFVRETPFSHRICLCTSPSGSFLSPLMSIFLGWRAAFQRLRRGRTHDYHPELVLAVHAWLDIQLKAGIDLVQYGKLEHACCSHIDTRVTCCMRWDNYKVGMARFISFTYGSEPKDWYLWVTEDFSNHFRLFWEMVEHPEWAMPGAWDSSSDALDDVIYDPDDDHIDFKWHVYTRKVNQI
ncbi:hypothetical protein PVAG01_07523 [Phlyctema vagabunda]|uniref:Uncharacterized protein n=1 Tax=Phlyctema vagabunda TaxID=108571 RepID=A0ABR4PCN3_9HELO